MRVIKTGQECDTPSLASQLAKTILAGGIVVLPTDTTYALACNALSGEALRRLFALKGRPANKPLTVAVADMEMASCYVSVTDTARWLAQAFLPGPLTLILRHRNNVPAELVAGGETLGIRVPKHRLVIETTMRTRLPITITSANISGAEPAYAVEELARQVPLSTREAYLSIVVDQGLIPFSPPSTLVDCTREKVVVLREGSITEAMIHQTLQRMG